ncbi:hypothetical protein FOZ63_007524 [Perkinsus olseni]|uniref:Uncharacterized protein n=1 Tax=Perkinsus olseni TaxID=32597 RepID=A0A7J6UMV2_PEROL|nr:hypothetical protein FOZ63_007524 [Perkinsus olseni]
MGAASVFFRLASHYLSLGLPHRAHNMHQLAMAFLWDFTKRPGGLECLEESNSVLWGINWDDFMNQYLSLAALLRRHEDDGLPPPLGVPVSYRNRSLRIGIASTCDYKEGSVLHGIDRISLENRQAYSALHGYHVEFRTDNHASAARSHIEDS